jgi:hypothetical protein
MSWKTPLGGVIPRLFSIMWENYRVENMNVGTSNKSAIQVNKKDVESSFPVESKGW